MEQLGRDGDLAPVLGAALQGPDRGGLEVNVHRPDGQGLGDPGAGGARMRAKVWSAGRGFEEALALIGDQLLAAAGVGELEITDQARHFCVTSGSLTLHHCIWLILSNACSSASGEAIFWQWTLRPLNILRERGLDSKAYRALGRHCLIRRLSNVDFTWGANPVIPESLNHAGVWFPTSFSFDGF